MFNSALLYELAVLKTYAEPLLKTIPEIEPEHAEALRLMKFLSYFQTSISSVKFLLQAFFANSWAAAASSINPLS